LRSVSFKAFDVRKQGRSYEVLRWNVRISQAVSAALIIKAPDDHRPERGYLFEVLFKDWMGLSYELHWVDEDYTLLSVAERSIKIPDLFFRNLPEKVQWKDAALPKEVFWIDNPSFKGDAMPSFFGAAWEATRSDTSIVLDCDVFAHAFFYLTRWEEIQQTALDRFSRIDEAKLLAVQHKFHYMPVLDMMFQGLRREMKHVLKLDTTDVHAYSVKLTHDVDHLRRFDSIKKWVNAMGGDVLLRKKPWLMFKTTWQFVAFQLGLRKDNYDRTDELMDISERHELTSHFYFIPSHKGEEDARYDIRSKVASATIQNIVNRGHVVGLHGSFPAAWDEDVFKEELRRLQLLVPGVEEGRMHYLRFKNPDTWRMWNDAGLKRDSSVGLSSDVGFRCGTARPFKVFDLHEREVMHLVEEPLILMEVALIRRYPKAEEGLKAAKQVMDNTRRYGGQLVYLWHPENLDHPHWGRYAYLYEAILAYATKEES
jgi:hypothetical protein